MQSTQSTTLIIPICSMRSHITGEYSLAKDGNIQLHLARAKPGSYMLLPSNNTDVDTVKRIRRDVRFITLDNWPVSAYDTRKTFWKTHYNKVVSLIKHYGVTAVITDITGSGLHNVVPTLIYNFNITGGVQDNPREYIDKFLLSDVYSVNNSSYTTVLNDSQKQTLVSNGADPSKIIIDRRVINSDLYMKYFDDEPLPVKGIFHPFRISDRCYRFDKVLEDVSYTDHRTVTITDPNDSYYGSEYEQLADDLLVNVIVKKVNKRQYYNILAGRPTVFYYEDPNKIFHPGLAELLYFGVQIVSPYKMPNIKELLV